MSIRNLLIISAIGLGSFSCGKKKDGADPSANPGSGDAKNNENSKSFQVIDNWMSASTVSKESEKWFFFYAPLVNKPNAKILKARIDGEEIAAGSSKIGDAKKYTKGIVAESTISFLNQKMNFEKEALDHMKAFIGQPYFYAEEFSLKFSGPTNRPQPKFEFEFDIEVEGQKNTQKKIWDMN